jgi:hypothetical protein
MDRFPNLGLYSKDEDGRRTTEDIKVPYDYESSAQPSWREGVNTYYYLGQRVINLNLIVFLMSLSMRYLDYEDHLSKR